MYGNRKSIEIKQLLEMTYSWTEMDLESQKPLDNVKKKELFVFPKFLCCYAKKIVFTILGRPRPAIYS